MFPRFDPVLFWNTLFDKGLLAIVAFFLGYLANQSLERYRSKLVIRAEAVRIKLARIGALVEEMSAWESDAKQAFVQFCQTSLDEIRSAKLVPALTNSAAAESAVEILLALNLSTLPPEVERRIGETVTPRWEALATEAREIFDRIHRYRFWLGEDLFRAMSKYCLQMQQAALLLTPTPDGVRAGRAAFSALTKGRPDIEAVLKHLLGEV